jgi:hypothetical protein
MLAFLVLFSSCLRSDTPNDATSQRNLNKMPLAEKAGQKLHSCSRMSRSKMGRSEKDGSESPQLAANRDSDQFPPLCVHADTNRRSIVRQLVRMEWNSVDSFLVCEEVSYKHLDR